MRLARVHARWIGELDRHNNLPKSASRLSADRAALEASAVPRAARVAALEKVLPHLCEVVWFLNPEWEPTTVKPIRARTRTPNLPAEGLLGAAIRVLKSAERPMTIMELVLAVADINGLDVSTSQKRQRFHTTINNGLKRTYRNELIVTPGPPDHFTLTTELTTPDPS